MEIITKNEFFTYCDKFNVKPDKESFSSIFYKNGKSSFNNVKKPDKYEIFCLLEYEIDDIVKFTTFMSQKNYSVHQGMSGLNGGVWKFIILDNQQK